MIALKSVIYAALLSTLYASTLELTVDETGTTAAPTEASQSAASGSRWGLWWGSSAASATESRTETVVSEQPAPRRFSLWWGSSGAQTAEVTSSEAQAAPITSSEAPITEETESRKSEAGTEASASWLSYLWRKSPVSQNPGTHTLEQLIDGQTETAESSAALVTLPNTDSLFDESPAEIIEMIDETTQEDTHNPAKTVSKRYANPDFLSRVNTLESFFGTIII